jgi:hypothetical protein
MVGGCAFIYVLIILLLCAAQNLCTAKKQVEGCQCCRTKTLLFVRQGDLFAAFLDFRPGSEYNKKAEKQKCNGVLL